ncbi:GntR family transcriptional regulator [Dactylosporangium sp. NPDC051541]|uniref:GntR family transcriptional regulator n=1 Tax=Dactylosporangium sp. NPDC051541 TaxID=3363977 RepID=UPI0037B226A3
MPRDGEPRYRSIAADLAGKIRTGVYAPGEALPPQRDLSTTYGVTLMTLRQALRELSDEGLIVQQPGRGTFVSPPHLAYRLGSLRSLTDDLRDQGFEVQTTVISASSATSPTFGEGALRLERVRSFAGRPSIHQISWVPPEFARRLSDVNFETTPLYTALSAAGIPVARATETISPALLDNASRHYLPEPPNTPVFVSTRLTYTVDDSLVVEDRAVILGTAMQIRAERAATALSMTWSSTTP